MNGIKAEEMGIAEGDEVYVESNAGKIKLKAKLIMGIRPECVAIDNGFGRAMVTILDSQLTTFAAAVIMFWLGSGPIRGFAVTLSIGIFTSIFTAVVVVRMMVALWVSTSRRRSRRFEVPI